MAISMTKMTQTLGRFGHAVSRDRNDPKLACGMAWRPKPFGFL